MTAGFLVYFVDLVYCSVAFLDFFLYGTYMVSEIRYNWTELEFTINSKFTAHIGSNLISYFKYAENINSNVSNFVDGWLHPGSPNH